MKDFQSATSSNKSISKIRENLRQIASLKYMEVADRSAGKGVHDGFGHSPSSQAVSFPYLPSLPTSPLLPTPRKGLLLPVGRVTHALI